MKSFLPIHSAFLSKLFSSLHTGSFHVSYIFVQKSFSYSFHIFVHSHYIYVVIYAGQWHSILTSKSIYYIMWNHYVHLTYRCTRRDFFFLLGGRKKARHKNSQFRVFLHLEDKNKFLNKIFVWFFHFVRQHPGAFLKMLLIT